MLVLLGLGVVTVAAAALVAYLVTTRAQAPVPRELLPSSPEYRNHQQMARWIERRLDDDMVRPLLPEADQAEGRRLLGDFYGEDR